MSDKPNLKNLKSLLKKFKKTARVNNEEAYKISKELMKEISQLEKNKELNDKQRKDILKTKESLIMYQESVKKLQVLSRHLFFKV